MMYSTMEPNMKVPSVTLLASVQGYDACPLASKFFLTLNAAKSPSINFLPREKLSTCFELEITHTPTEIKCRL